MKFSVLLLVCLCCLSGNSQVFFQGKTTETFTKNNILDKKPEFFNLDWSEGTSYVRQVKDIYVEIDSIDGFNLEVFLDSNEHPVFYGSRISTPVCADGECKLMHIDLFWTLLGDYAGFNRFKDLPLTKHDHEEFLEKDYLKLHHLLSDERSILKKRKLHDLVEKPLQSQSNDIDALSGATVAEVKESVVEGALYSCYVAWHIANGKIKKIIRDKLAVQVSEQLIKGMLRSNSSEYHLYALKHINFDEYDKYFEELIRLHRIGIPLVRGFILKSLPLSFWENEELQEALWQEFTKIDLNSRTLLLSRLEYSSTNVLFQLSSNLEVMSKNQMKMFLGFLEEEKLNKSVLKNLKKFSNLKHQTNSYLVSQFLDEL